MAEFDEALISCVKDYPCLYNSKSAEFKISWKKENAWAEVSKKVVFLVTTKLSTHYFQLTMLLKDGRFYVNATLKSIKSY